ncbi:hypothetical protein [Mycobacteroides abscessus]|uniref:hypothetical protein n=1 Tax=Mycobacteroides abscessus TaxID=36809 RepID=UPI000E6999B5|nr:hypothetical protein [Mycobacteroides abscessus]RIS79112.1 hypothetical protein D2E44_20815 [Mycobacteroides abscessus]
MVMKDRWAMPVGLRRASALLAIVALAVGGAKVAGDHTLPGSGFSTVATVAADPSGPTGGPGGDGGMNGSQFQPPGLPPQQPDYQGGINQPPLDQNSGISIYNSGNPQAPQQVPGQQAGQQPQQAQQPAHGTQIPDYQTATPYTQGPGKANPDYQAPQQQSPQQGQQPQQQQPSQVPTQQQQPQNKQDDTTQQLDQQQQQRQQQCMSAAQYYGIGQQMLSFLASAFGGAGSMFQQPSRKMGPDGECNCAPEQAGPQDSEPSQEQPKTPRSDQQINCQQPTQTGDFDDLDSTIPNTGENIGGDPKPGTNPPGPRLNGNLNPLNKNVPPGTRPLPTGTALGPQGQHYAFYSTPQVYSSPGVFNDNFVTKPSQIVDLANPSKIIGTSPLAQTSGAYDPASNTMLLTGNTSAEPGDVIREVWQSDPIDPKNPNGWINTMHRLGNVMPGDRESQLIALGSQGKDGFLFVGSSGRGPIEGVIASTPQELTQKMVGQVMVLRDINNVNGIDGPYGPTIPKQTIDSAGNGSLVLRLSQYWKPGADRGVYAPRVYETTCTVQ